MLGKVVAAVKSAIVGWARSIGDTMNRLVKPARALTGAARDAVRRRTELVAENALLRQQLIVARRKIKRPPLRDRDRILMVLLARFNGAWRDALHVAKPDLFGAHQEFSPQAHEAKDPRCAGSGSDGANGPASTSAIL